MLTMILKQSRNLLFSFHFWIQHILSLIVDKQVIFESWHKDLFAHYLQLPTVSLINRWDQKCQGHVTCLDRDVIIDERRSNDFSFEEYSVSYHIIMKPTDDLGGIETKNRKKMLVWNLVVGAVVKWGWEVKRRVAGAEPE